MPVLIRSALALALLALPVSGAADILTLSHDYDHDGTVLEGWIARPAVDEPRPAVIVVHQWGGPSDYEKKRATMLAQEGYVGFVADIYSRGYRPETMEERAALSSDYKRDPGMMRTRAGAAIQAVKELPFVDAGKVAIIGYCFGGTIALESARAGHDLQGFVSIHGGLSTLAPGKAGHVRGRILVQHGEIDPLVPPEEVEAFKREMAEAEAELRFIAYPGAVHSFTDPSAGDDPSRGVAYDEIADAASWQDLLIFLAEIFNPVE
ncbi:MAG TPA: dienelactone hydrolase family protein [Kiritimatiellia bacterium]|nr:dienelactone hydrolase family protein [Kiritimatiellia bacterium]